MKILRIISTLVVFSLLSVSVSYADSHQQFTPEQKKSIEKIVHDYLVTNPQVLMEASQALRAQQQKQMLEQAQAAIFANAQSLFNAKTSPVVGNPKGNVTLVEFFDYQCGHCKQMSPTISKIVNDDKNLRVVYKQLPIFGANSQFAAKAALASAKQGKFEAFHKSLMASKKPLSNEQVLSLAKSVGLNVSQLQSDMKNSSVEQELVANLKLAQDMGIMGTPAFVIAKTPFNKNDKSFFVPGAASQSTINNLINQARK